MILIVRFLLAVFIVSNAHRDTLNFQNSCMDDFRDTSTPFIIPNVQVSWMLSHYYDCHSEAVWFEFVNPEDNWAKMYFGAGVIIADRFSEVRVHAMIVGPGLPTPISDVPVDIPEQILNDPNMSENVIYLESPRDQTTCNHLCEIMQVDGYPENGRCVWHERYTNTKWWWVLDHDEIVIPVGGETYYVVAWEESFRKTKAVFGMGYWDEDFQTVYPEIEENQRRSACPRIDWFDDFSEKIENAERDENLPGDVCEEGNPPPNEVVYPGVSSDDSHDESSDHSHNDHSHDHSGAIDWTSGFGDPSSRAMTVQIGDTLEFEWRGNHNVYLMESKEKFDSCDFDGAIEIGSQSPTSYTIQSRPAYFACEISGHCFAGQKLEVTGDSAIATEEDSECENDDTFAITSAQQWGILDATSCSDLSAYCGISYMADVCPRTCGKCPETASTTIAETTALQSGCQDDDVFAVATAQQFGIQSATGCEDLSRYCGISYVSDVCPQTCGTCEAPASTTLAETTALSVPCEDNDLLAASSAAQFGILGGANGCESFSQFCSISFVADICPKTCGLCPCADDDEFAISTALQFGILANGCSDLSRMCGISYVADVCPATCGTCEESTSTTTIPSQGAVQTATEEPEPICEDGDEDTTNPCQPLYCEAGEWLHIIVDCAEQMGMECLAEWMPAAEGECCSSCPCDGSNGICTPKVCTDGSNAPVPPGECCGDMSLCPTTTTTTTMPPTHAPTTTTTTTADPTHAPTMTTTTTTTMPPTTSTTTSLIVIDDGYLLPDSGLLDSMVRMLNRDYSNARLIAAGQRAAALLQAKDEDKVKLATLYDPAVKGHLQKIRRFFKADESTYSEAVFNKQRVQYNKIAEIVGRDLGEW